MLHTIFFDLDNTLYSKESGVWEAISERINIFIETILKIDGDKVQEVRTYCRQNYATSLQGLKSLYQINDDEYLEFVHDIDFAKILSDDENLSALLSSLPQRKIIFTNSDSLHANKVLNVLGIRSYFDLIIDVISVRPFVKPHEEAFHKALLIAGLKSSNGCVFVDDIIENIEQASNLGFLSILIGDSKNGHLCIPDIFRLPGLLSSLN
ncbi:MAG: pyrimidine 5'-nucleotidase [Pelolinea sp.]|nr:pyrimidine 5'-nucleotidase [Pelolinea sp.]